MSDPESRYGISRILSQASLLRLGLIGIIVAGVVICFVWAAGWLSPGRVDQTRIINTFEAASGGPHPGFRRNHAKGVCLTGWFDSNGAGERFSRAIVFRAGRTPVFGRISLAGGMPRQADTPGAVRSLALNFVLSDGEAWRTGMVDLPVFPVRDPKAFYQQMVVSLPDPKTGKPDPAALKAFLDVHPETVAAGKIIKAQPMSSGFADATYHALNAFRFVSTNGVSTPVRWSMVPVDAVGPTNKEQDKDYLFDALQTRLQRGPVQWRLIVTIGRPGDPTNDATLPWPTNREQVDAGTLSVNALQTESDGNCRDISFDPLVLPAGIIPSDDPLLSTRSAAYSVSFRRRASEPKTPSAVQPGKGT
ncbi:MAG TPA: catalase family peroxidase [Rhizomicrobium sp.]|jgi:catalase